MFGLGPTELAIIACVLLLIFGPAQLPKLGRGIGGLYRGIKDCGSEIGKIGEFEEDDK